VRSFVAGGDRTKLLDLGEEVLDQMPRFVQVAIVGPGVLAVGLGRDHGRLAGLLERLEHALLRIESLVSDQRLRGEAWQQGVGTFKIVRLPRREREAGRVAECVNGGVDLGAQAAAATSDRLVGPAVFLSAPALC
jgi:hypothetical protein